MPIFIDISYLRSPDFQSVFVLPDEYLHQMESILDHLDSFEDRYWNVSGGIGHHQRGRLRRILELMKKSIPPEERETLESEVYQFFNEHDRRRGTNFLKTFPRWNIFGTMPRGCSMKEFVVDLYSYMRVRKKYWLLTVLLVLLVLGVLMAVGQSSPVMPFVYPFF